MILFWFFWFFIKDRMSWFIRQAREERKEFLNQKCTASCICYPWYKHNCKNNYQWKFIRKAQCNNVKFTPVNISNLYPICFRYRIYMHLKPTYRHQYLHCPSRDLRFTKKSVVLHQALCISIICSSGKDFQIQIEEMKSWLRKRQHPEDLISS